MVRWGKLFGADHRNGRHSVLPTRNDRADPSPIAAVDVTKVALRLKHQIETVIPCEIDEARVTTPLSGVVTKDVVDTSLQAGGEEHKACVVYALLVCKRWFKKQSLLEPWDSDLHLVRAVACEVIAKRIIEGEEDLYYLLEQLLLRRFCIQVDDEDSLCANAVELAVDMHALTVIGSSGFQKCIQYLWKGWLVQDDVDTSRFVPYEDKTNTSYWVHLDPDRLRAPRYQNAVQVIISIVYLALYTGAINTINPKGDIDPVEALLYTFTLGFMCDEISKLWKVGRFYFNFWNAFHLTLYALLTASFVTRMIALGHAVGADQRTHFNHISYNFLAFTAPMFWMRLMLYFDTFRFFGTMLVVVKIMMKESLIFFALLVFVIIGFFQAFIGLDLVDNDLDAASFIFASMANAILSSPDFGGFDNFAPPFGIILYYLFTFVVMVVLLNVLVALYNSAYSDVTENAIDEYMALFAQKCLQFVRAPDENVFIPPFNLIELALLVLPFEWWMPKLSYARLNDIVMGVIYSPLLVVTAFLEQRDAWVIKDNRRRGEEDEDTVEEWEQLDWKPHAEDSDWADLVTKTSPDVKTDPALRELQHLKLELAQVKELLAKLLENM